AVSALERTNVPLKNWGGFALYRDAVYDDLERLVTSGLAGRTVLNTKPLSRTEAAAIVARAINAIRNDREGIYNNRRDLEAVLDRLMEEFASELVALGVAVPGHTGSAPSLVSFVPIDRGMVWGGFANRDLSLPYNQGRRFQGGANTGTTFESRLQIGDVLSFYLQPEAQRNEEYGALRLASGYVKLTLMNVELLVGRESLWWGPGLHGSLIMSNNAPPLDQIRLGSAEPFLLPWVGEWVGPMKILFFLAQLEERRDHPRAKLAGMRATVSPFSFLELGVSRTVMFDGEDQPRLEVSEYWRPILDPPAGDDRVGEAKFRSNNLFAIDADLRIPNVDRVLPVRDARLYGEFGWDDTCCNSNFIPLREAISVLLGVHFLGVFGQEGLDARAEYARSSSASFRHGQFRDGYWTRGEVISHIMGTEGEDFYARTSNRFHPNVMIGLELHRSVIGNTRVDVPGRKERTLAGGIDVSVRFLDVYSVFAQYRLAHVDNRNFRPSEDGWDNMLRFEVTRSFR
ncbi:MAG TPA: capsule assembly Wzi family protein, partial [Candidatus Limnocylindrales bacterium]|nr:capsule assembly Wzi family protein [Candidatus Limnocylindrales bacterium]